MSEEDRLIDITGALVSIADNLDDLTTILKQISDGLAGIEVSIDGLKNQIKEG